MDGGFAKRLASFQPMNTSVQLKSRESASSFKMFGGEPIGKTSYFRRRAQEGYSMISTGWRLGHGVMMFSEVQSEFEKKTVFSCS